MIAFKKMVTSWSDELAQWTVTLTVDIGDGIDNAMSYVISDIKSAIHAISSFFHALGADLKTAWEWLKHNVLELIKNADANAKVIQGWLTQAVAVPDGPLLAIINHIEISSDTFFRDLNDEITKTYIPTLASTVENKLFGTSEPMPPPPTDSKSDDSDIIFKVGGDIAKVWQHSPCGWLYDKLESHLPKDAAPDFDATVFSQVLADLVNDVVDATTTIVDLGTTFYDAMKLAAGTKDELNAMSVADFFGTLSKLVSDALTLLDKLVDTVLDALKAAVTLVGDVLTYQYQAVPLIGDLLDAGRGRHHAERRAPHEPDRVLSRHLGEQADHQGLDPVPLPRRAGRCRGRRSGGGMAARLDRVRAEPGRGCGAIRLGRGRPGARLLRLPGSRRHQ